MRNRNRHRPLHNGRMNTRVERDPYRRQHGDPGEFYPYNDRISQEGGTYYTNPRMSRRERLGINPRRNNGPTPRVRGGRGRTHPMHRGGRGRSCCGG